jgi:hypothetical protein
VCVWHPIDGVLLDGGEVGEIFHIRELNILGEAGAGLERHDV